MDARHLLSPSLTAAGEPRLLISRKALLHNARLIRRRLRNVWAAAGASAPDRPSNPFSPAPVPRPPKVCAILKADAYGHGAAIVADTLCNWTDDGSDTPPADALAVASIDEAAALPHDISSRVPVVVFRPLENCFVGRQRPKVEEAVRAGWMLTLCSTAGAEDLARVAQAIGTRAAVQVMVDTGMTRSGVTPEQLPALLRKIDSRPALRLCGLCTHFASSDEPAGDFTAEQLHRFTRATGGYADYARGRVVRHAANSAAIFFEAASHLDMVRPGLALYGIDPCGRPHLDRPLRPVMKWTAPLVGVSEIAEGESVGYGQTWRAPRRARVGLLPVGYADGYPRCFSNRAFVIVQGQPAPVVGRVSMDLTTIDLTDHPHAVVGEEVTLLDDDPLSPASVYNLAKWADTIPYEIVSRIGPRVRRVVADAEEARGDELLEAREEDGM